MMDAQTQWTRARELSMVLGGCVAGLRAPSRSSDGSSLVQPELTADEDDAVAHAVALNLCRRWVERSSGGGEGVELRSPGPLYTGPHDARAPEATDCPTMLESQSPGVHNICLVRRVQGSTLKYDKFA
jgi:hypothetical protein